MLYVVYRHVLYRDMPGINTGINTGTKDPSTRLVWPQASQTCTRTGLVVGTRASTSLVSILYQFQYQVYIPASYQAKIKLGHNRRIMQIWILPNTQDQAGMFTSEIGTIQTLVSTRYRDHIFQQYCNKLAETRVSTKDHIPRSNHSWTKP